MSKQVKILSGISGGGKSTLAGNLIAGCHVQNPTFSAVVSADNFFMLNGEYVFQARLLGHAHADCFRKFIEAMQEVHDFTHTDGEVVHLPNNLIIVDNTNTTAEEIAPYVLGAAAFDYEAEIITIMPTMMDSLDLAAERNKHGVPRSVISQQFRRLCNRSLPPYWKARTVPFHHGA